MWVEALPGLALGITLAICMATDVLQGKIYNWVVVPAMLFGLAFSSIMQGLSGLLGSAGGLVLGGGLLFLPFALHVFGGGDVKLAAAVGAICGPLYVLQTVIFAFLGAAVATLVMRTVQGRLPATLTHTVQFFAGALPGRKPPASRLAQQTDTIPFALCLAGGALVARWSEWHGIFQG
jgi:prepilin peptidase CpaA